MPPVGFEPTISAGERPQTYALNRAATGTGNKHKLICNIRKFFSYRLENTVFFHMRHKLVNAV